MGLKIRQNGTTYSLPYGDYTYRQTTHSLCYKKNGTVYYCPLCKENETIYIDVLKEPEYVHYDKTVYPRIACKIAGEIYYAPNKLGKIGYSIPAGTYTPSAFRSLIEHYISNNGNRTVSNSFTVKVNNQTVFVSAGQKIYYTVSSSSPQGYMRTVYFNPSYAVTSGMAPSATYNNPSSGFTNGHAYVVYNTGSGYWYPGTQFQNWANYSITVNTGINFS